MAASTTIPKIYCSDARNIRENERIVRPRNKERVIISYYALENEYRNTENSDLGRAMLCHAEENHVHPNPLSRM